MTDPNLTAPEAMAKILKKLRMMPTYSGDPKGPHWLPDVAADMLEALAARLAEVEAERVKLNMRASNAERMLTAAEAALAATCQREAASIARWEAKLAASAVSIPTEPGGFVGDVWFGHPTKRTLGTHKWSGSEWVELPSELDSVLQLLSEARQKLAASEARVKRLREALTLAANRLQREAVNYTPNSTGFFQVSEYADDARAALEETKP
jgi:chromosome segregation ATPase